MGTLSRLLARGHARVIENLLEPTPDCQQASSDGSRDADVLAGGGGS